MKKVQIITDGACLGNPGPGGWAAVLRFNELKKEIWNSEKHTTNNRMELTAAIEGLKSLREQCEVEVVTDSEYVKNGITTWIHGWKRHRHGSRPHPPPVAPRRCRQLHHRSQHQLHQLLHGVLQLLRFLPRPRLP